MPVSSAHTLRTLAGGPRRASNSPAGDAGRPCDTRKSPGGGRSYTGSLLHCDSHSGPPRAPCPPRTVPLPRSRYQGFWTRSAAPQRPSSQPAPAQACSSPLWARRWVGSWSGLGRKWQPGWRAWNIPAPSSCTQPLLLAAGPGCACVFWTGCHGRVPPGPYTSAAALCRSRTAPHLGLAPAGPGFALASGQTPECAAGCPAAVPGRGPPCSACLGDVGGRGADTPEWAWGVQRRTQLRTARRGPPAWDMGLREASEAGGTHPGALHTATPRPTGSQFQPCLSLGRWELRDLAVGATKPYMPDTR